MTESLISEWLADCKDVAPSELHMFARTLSQDNEIVRALYVLLEERTKYSEVRHHFLEASSVYAKILAVLLPTSARKRLFDIKLLIAALDESCNM